MDKHGVEQEGGGIEAGIELDDAWYEYRAHLLDKVKRLPRPVLEEKYLALVMVMRSVENLLNAVDDGEEVAP